MWPFSNKKKKLEVLYHRISYTEKATNTFNQKFVTFFNETIMR